MQARRLAIAAGASLLAVFLSVVREATADPPTEAAIDGSLPSLLAHADRGSPAYGQARMATEAARRRVDSAGAWDDPMIRIEPEDVLGSGFRPLPGQPPRTRYQLMQDIPWQGKRGLRREIAAAGAAEAAAGEDRIRSALHAAIRRAQAQWLEGLGRREVVASQSALFEDLESVARARYARGLAPQGDVLRAQVELTRLNAEQESIDGMVAAAAARLNALLGRTEAAPLTPPEGQALERVPDLEQALGRVERDAPEVRMATALFEAADSQRALAFRERWPDLRVGVMAMQRDAGEDEWGLMLEFNVPLRLARRRAEEAERLALRDAARLAQEDVHARAAGGLREAHAQARAAMARHDLAERVQFVQSQLTLEAALAAYRTGATDFLAVIDAALQIKQAQLDAVAASADYRRQLAEFLDLLGEA